LLGVFFRLYDHTSSPAPGIKTLLLHKQALRFKKCIANLPWVARKLPNPQSLTHAAAAVDQSGYVHLVQQCCACTPLFYSVTRYTEFVE